MNYQKLLNQINKLLSQVTFLRKRLVIKFSNDYLGIDFTPNDITPDEVACAESVTTIMVRAGLMQKVITGTYTLMEYLNRSQQWVNVNEPEEGDIALFATGTSKFGKKAPFVGHVFIVGKNNLWYSNDSWTGKWSAHYTKEQALERYQNKGGYQPLYYRYISVL